MVQAGRACHIYNTSNNVCHTKIPFFLQHYDTLHSATKVVTYAKQQ